MTGEEFYEYICDNIGMYMEYFLSKDPIVFAIYRHGKFIERYKGAQLTYDYQVPSSTAGKYDTYRYSALNNTIPIQYMIDTVEFKKVYKGLYYDLNSATFHVNRKQWNDTIKAQGLLTNDLYEAAGNAMLMVSAYDDTIELESRLNTEEEKLLKTLKNNLVSKSKVQLKVQNDRIATATKRNDSLDLYETPLSTFVW